MNMNFKLDVATILPQLKKFGPFLVGLSLVGLFGYTGYVINDAFNVKPADPAAAATAHITFDKATVEAVKNLHVIPGDVPTGNLGKSDPFGQ
jgi:hypothetical protein